MSFSRKREILNFPYTLDSTDIIRVEVVRDLGGFVAIATNLNHHVTTIKNASFRVLRAFTCITRSFSKPIYFYLFFFNGA